MDDPNDGTYSRPPTLEDVARICQALNQERARYVLIGGFAVIIHAASGAENVDVGETQIPVADKHTLIRTKQTIRPSDHMDCEYLAMRIAAEKELKGH